MSSRILQPPETSFDPRRSVTSKARPELEGREMASDLAGDATEVGRLVGFVMGAIPGESGASKSGAMAGIGA
jgi:hypothetical protein